MQSALAEDLEREGTGSGEARAAAILGTVQVPCSLSCEHCERLKSQLDRYMPSRKVMYSKNLLPIKSSLSSNKPYPQPPAYRCSSLLEERICARPGSPLELGLPNRRYAIPPPIVPRVHVSEQMDDSSYPQISRSNHPASENGMDPIDDVVVPTSPSIKQETSTNTSPLSSPSSPLLNLDAFDRNSIESADLLDQIQLDEASSLSFSTVQNFVDDLPLARRTRGDSTSIRLQDLIDMPLGMNFDLEEDPTELHSLLTGYPDFKLDPFGDETTVIPSCDELDALSRLPLLDGLGRVGDCDLLSTSFKQECPSPSGIPLNLGSIGCATQRSL